MMQTLPNNQPVAAPEPAAFKVGDEVTYIGGAAGAGTVKSVSESGIIGVEWGDNLEVEHFYEPRELRRAPAAPAEEQAFKCAKCGASGVRLYRPFSSFLRAEQNFCNVCVPADERGWYVPLCPASDGTVWGYTSVPPEAVAAWDALPEKDPSLPGAFNRGRTPAAPTAEQGAEKPAPCPFCGSDDVGTDCDGSTRIWCRACGAGSRFIKQSIYEAVSAWNKRWQPARPGLVAAADAVMKMVSDRAADIRRLLCVDVYPLLAAYNSARVGTEVVAEPPLTPSERAAADALAEAVGRLRSAQSAEWVAGSGHITRATKYVDECLAAYRAATRPALAPHRSAEELAEAVAAVPVRAGQKYWHRLSGMTYQVLAVALVEATHEPVVVYRYFAPSIDLPHWTRPASEFTDGRFMLVDQPATQKASKPAAPAPTPEEFSADVGLAMKAASGATERTYHAVPPDLEARLVAAVEGQSTPPPPSPLLPPPRPLYPAADARAHGTSGMACSPSESGRCSEL